LAFSTKTSSLAGVGGGDAIGDSGFTSSGAGTGSGMSWTIGSGDINGLDSVNSSITTSFTSSKTVFASNGVSSTV
jgi:hypothetical protein